MSKPRMGAPKRVAVGLLAGSLAMFGVALAPQAGATTTVTNERLAGATRYGTAAAIAANAAFGTPTTAIIATGENFPDALAAASLAGANAAAPIILTERDTYTPEAKSGLAALKGKGVTTVTIVGGTSAVSDAVETAIKGDGFTSSRIAGDDRYETAAAIASAANTKSAAAPIAGLKSAFIATGTNYPDALAGGPAAYANKLPLLLVNDTVPTDTANAISTLGIKKVYILGGTSAVSSAVEAQLVQATGNPATRIAGTDRFATASAIGDFEQATLAFPVTSAILATGVNFPDALAAGPLGGQLKAPIVLTASLPDASKAWLDKNSKTISKLYVAGGTSSIDDATVTAATTAAQNTSNDIAANATVTSRPEITSASVRGTVTTGLLAGTTVRYTFDEPVNPAGGTGAAGFHVYSASGTQTNGTSLAAVTGDANSVDVLFGIVSASTAAGLTVATTSLNAITDLTGEGSPEGDAQLGATGSTSAPLAAGTTVAPDLLTVGNFRAANATNTFVDFTFDQAAVPTANTYYLETLAGTVATEVTCVYDNGGNTVALITVRCPNSAGVPLTAASFARGVVDAGTVAATAAAGSALNPLEAADISNGGNTGTPDLVSATIDFSDTTKDLMNLVFDQAVATTGAASTGFQAYTANTPATPVVPIAGATGSNASGASPTSIQLVFANGALANAVGVSVNNGAVANVGGANPGATNVRDEVGTANAASSTTAAGRTSTPDLIGVKKAAAVDLFNTPTGGTTFTFTFDETVTTAVAANYFIYAADGTRSGFSTCTALTSSGLPTANVVCSGYTVSNTVAAAAVLGTVTPGAAASATTLGNPTNAAEGAEVITS